MPNTFDKTLDICGLCKYWSRNKIGCDAGVCSKNKTNCLFYYCACDKFKSLKEDNMSNTCNKTLEDNTPNIFDICGKCKYWFRIKTGSDAGICSKSKERPVFDTYRCAKFEPFESDPNGLKAKDAGAKLDTGKIRADLLEDFGPGLLKIAAICDYGAKKYSEKGWLEVPDAQKRYKAAFWRHLLAGEGIDPESGLSHVWHCAWNLLAMLTISDN